MKSVVKISKHTGGVKVSSRERTEEKVEAQDRGFSGNHMIGTESCKGTVAAM